MMIQPMYSYIPLKGTEEPIRISQVQSPKDFSYFPTQNGISIFYYQDLYLAKDPYSLPSKLSLPYTQALKTIFSKEETFQNCTQEEKDWEDSSFLLLGHSSSFLIDQEDLPDEPEKLEEVQASLEEDNFLEESDSFDLKIENPLEDENLDGSLSFSSSSTSSLLLSLEKQDPLFVSTKSLLLEFEEKYDGYLRVEQGNSIQTFPLDRSSQPLVFLEDQVTLTLLNSQQEILASWLVCYEKTNNKVEQEALSTDPFSNLPLTSTTLVAPIVVDDHTKPFGLPVVQDIPKQSELVVDTFYEPLVLEEQEEVVSTPLPATTITSPFKSGLALGQEKLPSLVSSLASSLPVSSTVSSFTSSTSSFSSTLPSRSSLDSSSIPISTPTLQNLEPTGVEAKENGNDLPSIEQLAYPPIESTNSPSISTSQAVIPQGQISDQIPLPQNTSSSGLKSLKKELEKQALEPLATVQQAGQLISQGHTLYVKNPNDVQVQVENGTLQEIKVRSNDTKKIYTNLELAMNAEKQATFELEAQLKNNESQITQAKWTIVPLKEPIQQAVSVPAGQVEAFYTLEENGQLTSYRQSDLTKALLCRGFEPLETQTVFPGEKLRMYVEEGEYDLSINGKKQVVKVQQDELGQPYLSIPVGPLKTDIALQKNGQTIYKQSLQTNNPLWRFGWLAPFIGSLVGIGLDVRRRKWV